MGARFTSTRDKTQTHQNVRGRCNHRQACPQGTPRSEDQDNLIVATIASIVTSTAWYYGVNKARKDAYANFYKTYDAHADFQRMKEAGVFQSVKIIEEAAE